MGERTFVYIKSGYPREGDKWASGRRGTVTKLGQSGKGVAHNPYGPCGRWDKRVLGTRQNVSRISSIEKCLEQEKCQDQKSGSEQ